MLDRDICVIKMILESEQRRIDAMLGQIDKPIGSKEAALLEQGFELAEHYMRVGRDLCKEYRV